MAITKLNSQGVSDAIATDLAQAGRKNLIINGAMQVAQRGTQVTGYTNSEIYITCDRFAFGNSSLGTWTIDQSTDSPNEFSNSLKATCTTADASPASTDYMIIYHRIEAQNLQQLAYGTADAKNLTLSFWVKSNKTGSASLDVLQQDNSVKLFSTSYSINVADSWEKKTISIPADTAGLINNDNGVGLQLDWWLNGGSDFSGGSFATTWQTYDATARNASNLGVGGATSDYFAITGVQLEVGDTATDFEHRSYGEELALCQRYFEVVDNKLWLLRVRSSDDLRRVQAQFAVTKRADPTVTLTDTVLDGATSIDVGTVGISGIDFGGTGVSTSSAPRIDEFTADAEL